jgi:hypothetical protein
MEFSNLESLSMDELETQRCRIESELKRRRNSTDDPAMIAKRQFEAQQRLNYANVYIPRPDESQHHCEMNTRPVSPSRSVCRCHIL